MKKLLYFSLLLFSCSSSSLDGNWNLQLHEYYEMNKNQPMQESEKPFQTWEILDGKIKVDGVEEYYSLRNDTITITYKEDFKHFLIISKSETSLLLKSYDLTPGTYSFYYFFK